MEHDIHAVFDAALQEMPERVFHRSTPFNIQDTEYRSRMLLKDSKVILVKVKLLLHGRCEVLIEGGYLEPRDLVDVALDTSAIQALWSNAYSRHKYRSEE